MDSQPCERALWTAGTWFPGDVVKANWFSVQVKLSAGVRRGLELDTSGPAWKGQAYTLILGYSEIVLSLG